MAATAPPLHEPTPDVALSKEAANMPSTPSNDSADDEPKANPTTTTEKDAEAATPPPQKPPMFSMPPVPDGGLQAWLQVAGSFSLFFNTWGNLNTFGVFQNYYATGGLFIESSSNIAWIGAVQAFLVLLTGVFSGPVYDRGYLRLLLVSGSFLVIFGYMMLSLCTEFWQVVLAQGFCVGLGGGLLFVPAVAILPSYFSKRLGLAVGLAAAGSSMGGVIYPIVFYKLLGEIGFPWATRVLGFIALATLIVPVLTMKQRFKPPRARSMFDKATLTDWPFVIFVVALVLGFTGFYVMAFFLSEYSSVQHITDDSLSFYLIPILNAASVFGRTVPNAISDKVGAVNIVGPGSIICSILVFCMIAVDSVAGIVVLTILFGFFSGIFIALPPVCFAVLTKDKSKLGTRFGMAFGVVASAVLLGGPAGGAVLGSNIENLNWTGTWVYGGVFIMASAIITTSLRFYLAGGKLKYKI